MNSVGSIFSCTAAPVFCLQRFFETPCKLTTKDIINPHYWMYGGPLYLPHEYIMYYMVYLIARRIVTSHDDCGNTPHDHIANQKVIF